MPRILLVDDESERLGFLKENLQGTEEDPYCVEQVACWFELQDKLRYRYPQYDLFLFDVDFGNLDSSKLLRSEPARDDDIALQGYLILKEFRNWEEGWWQRQKSAPCFKKVMMTSGKVPSIVGMEEYINAYGVETYWAEERSPQDPELARLIEQRVPPRDESNVKEWQSYGIVCGSSRQMYELMHRAEQIAKRDCHVWIDGPTGSGKELIARFIHQRSNRACRLETVLLGLLYGLKNLNGLGAAVFGSGVDTLPKKVRMEFDKGIVGFSMGDSTVDENKLRQLLKALCVPDDATQQLLDKINDTENFHQNQRATVYLTVHQIAELWSKSQKAPAPKRGLWNFHALNCATFPSENDLLMMLFGFPSGTYTNVPWGKPGILQTVSYTHGTLFLDEIAELSLQAQADLLRVIQEGELRRLNSNVPEQVNVRVIAATNKDIGELVREGKFRFDLLMRLMQARIKLPSLQEREEDFQALTEFFLKSKQQEMKEETEHGEEPIILEFDDNALRYLQSNSQRWEGNIRALRNVVEGAYETAILEKCKRIDIGHVRRTLDILWDVQLSQKQPPTSDSAHSSDGDPENLISRAVGALDSLSLDHLDKLQEQLKEQLKSAFAAQVVEKLIQKHNGNPPQKYVPSTAEILGVAVKDVHNKKWMKVLIEQMLRERGLYGDN